MPSTQITLAQYSIIIHLMQADEKLLAEKIGLILTRLREKTGKSNNLFCNEYGLPPSTANSYERGKTSLQAFQLMRIVKAHGITMSEFFEMVEKELPKDFLKPEE